MTTQRINLDETIKEEFGFGPGVLREVRAWELVEICDTRMIDEEWKPISGTGNAVECECCGRFIEVHATVVHRISSEEHIVGTQCCKKAKMNYGMMSPTNKNYWKKNLTRKLT